MPEPGNLHRSSTRVLSTVMILIGIVLLISTIARGGGPFAFGVLMGILFAGAGVARLYLERGEQEP